MRKKIVLGIISVCLCSFLLLPVQTLAEEEVSFLPILDEKYGRLGILLTDSAGKVIFKKNLQDW